MQDPLIRSIVETAVRLPSWCRISPLHIVILIALCFGGCAGAQQGGSAEEEESLDTQVSTGSEEHSAPVILPQLGPAAYVQTLVTSGDGKIMVTSQRDGWLNVWDAHSLDFRGSLGMVKKHIHALSFQPAGSHLVSITRDRMALLWDLTNGKSKPLGKARIEKARFSPDGRWLATVHSEFVETWHAAGHRRKTLKTGWVNDVAFSPDGEYLVAWAPDRNVQMWRLRRSKQLWTYPAKTTYDPADQTQKPPRYGAAVIWGPEGRQLAWAVDKGVVVVNAENGRQVRFIPIPSQVEHMVWVARGLCMAFRDHGKWTIRTVRLDSVDPLETRIQQRLPNHVSFSPDGRWLAARTDRGIEVFNTVTGTKQRKIPRRSCCRIDQLYWHSRSKHLFATMSSIPGIWQLDLTTGARRRTTREKLTAGPFIWSPNGRRLAAVLGGKRRRVENTVYFWDLPPGSIRTTLFAGLDLRVPRSLAWTADVFITGGNAEVATTDAQVLEPLHVLEKGDRSDRYQIDLSPDNRIVATVSRNHGRVRLWHVISGKRLQEFGSGRRGGPVVFSRDGAKLAVGSADQVSIYRTTTGQLLQAIAHGQKHIEALVWIDDHHVLAAPDRGPVVRIETGSGKIMGTFEAHAERTRQLAMHPNGTTLATAGQDHPDSYAWRYGPTEDPGHTVKLWRVDTLELIKLVPGENRQSKRRPVEGLAFSPDGKVLGIAHGSTQLWRLVDGESLFLRMFWAVRDRARGWDRVDGVAYTASGLYGGDPPATERLRWRLGSDLHHSPLLGPDEARPRFNRPRIGRDFLAGKPMKIE